MSEMLAPPFNIGAAVWVASATPFHQTEVPCPICFGKRIVTLILGNDEQQPVECDWCKHGLGGPTGMISRYTVHSQVKEGTVSGIVQSFGDWRIEVDGHTCDAGCIFRDPANAEARRIVLHAEAEKQAQRNFESQFKGAKKKATWSAGYHRREIQELRRRLEWHEAKLGKVKEETP